MIDKSIKDALKCCAKGKCGNCPFADFSDDVVECERTC
jgi:hypothetical protein